MTTEKRRPFRDESKPATSAGLSWIPHWSTYWFQQQQQEGFQ
ncbi:hypothetical protein ES703_57004 [subsurface metagenome]